MYLDPSLKEEQHSLKCPACGDSSFYLIPLFGDQGEKFIRIQCQTCNEQIFFQIPERHNALNETDQTLNEWKKSEFNNLQTEWHEWLDWKKRHLQSRAQTKSFPAKTKQWLLAFILLLLVTFFALDQLHLLDPIFENPQARQQTIIEYSQHILEIPCIPSIMKVKARTVPIRYTRERPIHGNMIQYGEAGIYWGEEQIKIHRSNFWFFGSPKKSQMIHTLIHELRHRISPGLGHNQKFYDLVDRDTQCALSNW